jgi:hypothetical protein
MKSVKFTKEHPARDFYWKFSQAYYWTPIMEYMRYVALYGQPENSEWAYDVPEGAKVVL